MSSLGPWARAVAIGGFLMAGGLTNADAADLANCDLAISAVEKAAHLPNALLRAIGIVESGRMDPVSRQMVPWPWSINVEGTDYVFETRAEAIAAVQAAQKAGRHSIDVGCMQINLAYHPVAFASLEEAFDPMSNATYAAAFLNRLHLQIGDWGDAAAAYHSQTPGLADDYRRRVVAGWSAAAAYGVTQAWGEARKQTEMRVRPEPAGGYTPEFRARLAKNVASMASLRTSMGFALGRTHLPVARPAHFGGPGQLGLRG